MRKVLLIIIGLFLSIIFFENISGQEKKDDNFYLGSGLVKYYNNDYIGAIKDFSKAIELNPKFEEAYFNRGFTKYLLGDYSGAIKDYSKAIELNPKNGNAYLGRGIANIKLNRKKEGCLDLSKAGEMGFKEAYELIRELCN